MPCIIQICSATMLSGSYLRLQTQLPCKNFALSNKDVNKEAVNEIMIM